MGRLFIKTALREGKTVIGKSGFTAPFKITKPFYHGETAEIMIMQASAGILEGDRHELEFHIAAGTSAAVTGQSYTKLFKMDEGFAEQSTKITVDDGACLYYMPCPVIPFAGSRFVSTNKIYLAENSKFMLWDIFACGRVGMNERLAFSKYHSRTEVYVGGRPVFLDNTRLVPEEADISGTGYFEGYTHQGTAYFYGFDNLAFCESDNPAAYTSAERGTLVRILARSSDEIEKYIKSIIKGGKDDGK